jgi:hypothetical protein
MTQLTVLLGRIQAGDAQARDALFAIAYPELLRLARSRLRDGGRNTLLETTDRAFAQRDNDLCALKGAPLLKNLEGDPRYTALLRRMHLSQ